jgi:YD repeat-containing protein
MKKLILTIATAALIAGCGGSSGSSTDDAYTGPYRLSKIDVYVDGAPRAAELSYSYELVYGADNYLSRLNYLDSDGTQTESSEYTFDADGNLIKIVMSDETMEYNYDADGNLMSYTTDEGNDGESDEAVTYAYDAEGAMTGYNSYRPTNTMVNSVRLSYDAEGTLATIEYDSEPDGIFEEVHALTFDANGNLIEDAVTENSVADETKTYIHDAENKLTKIEVDSDLDGSADAYTDYEYDSDGKMTRVAYYEGAGVTPLREVLLTYDRGTELGTDIVRTELYNDIVYKNIFMFGD